MVDDGNQTFYLWAAGIYTAAITALFGYTHHRINDVRSDIRTDMEQGRENTKSDLMAVESKIHDVGGEHRQAQQQLWSELRLSEVRANDHRQKVQERISDLQSRIGLLPTREEMKDDLVAMEQRIANILRVEPRKH